MRQQRHRTAMAAAIIGLTTMTTLFSNPATATCYWPTGNATYARDEYEHMPCSNDTTSPLSTICCALNRTNPSGGDKLYGRTNDECLPNGVCRNRVLDHGTMQVSYWRETCTERDWKSGLCLDVCSDDWTSGNGTTGAVMTPCDGTEKSLTWCCGISTDCCKDPTKVKTLPFEFRGAIPNTASATPRPLASETSSPTPSVTAGGGGLTTGAKAGIGVGAVVGAFLLIGLGFFLARRMARSTKNSDDHQHRGNNDSPHPNNNSPYTNDKDGTLTHVTSSNHEDQAPPSPLDKGAEYYAHELETRAKPELESVPARSPEPPPVPRYEMA